MIRKRNDPVVFSMSNDICKFVVISLILICIVSKLLER